MTIKDLILDEDTLEKIRELTKKKKRGKKDVKKVMEKCMKLASTSKDFLETYIECMRLGGNLPKKKKQQRRKRKRKEEKKDTEDQFINMQELDLINSF